MKIAKGNKTPFFFLFVRFVRSADLAGWYDYIIGLFCVLAGGNWSTQVDRGKKNDR